MDMALKKSSIIIIIIITSGYFVSFWGVTESFRENTLKLRGKNQLKWNWNGLRMKKTRNAERRENLTAP